MSILQEASTLSVSELDQLMVGLAALRAQKVAPPLPHTEAVLLERIYTMVPLALRQRWATLIEMQQTQSLTESQATELAQLVDQLELLQAERAECLAELARLRGVKILELTERLGLRPRDMEAH